jgi:chromosome condensin MukBEF MukE localization factor
VPLKRLALRVVCRLSMFSDFTEGMTREKVRTRVSDRRRLTSMMKHGENTTKNRKKEKRKDSIFDDDDHETRGLTSDNAETDKDGQRERARERENGHHLVSTRDIEETRLRGVRA